MKPVVADPHPKDAFEQSINRAAGLLKQEQVAQAMELLRDLSQQKPDNPMVLFLLGIGQRKSGLLAQAIEIQKTLTNDHPDFAAAWQELGLCLRLSGHRKQAMEAFRKATQADPNLVSSWKFLGDMALLLDDEQTAIHAYAQYPSESKDDPMLARALELIEGEKLRLADIVLRKYLTRHPGDAFALYSQSRIATKLSAVSEAIGLLEASLKIAPANQQALFDYINLLSQRQCYEEALLNADKLLALAPENRTNRLLKAALLERTGQYPLAVNILSKILEENPQQSMVWTGLGGLQRTLGLRAEAITSLQKAIDYDPSRGEAWYLLADLKNYTFTEAQVKAMRRSVAQVPRNSEDEIYFSFALARALEDQGAIEESFRFYVRGNDAKAQTSVFNPAAYDNFIASMISHCSKELFDKEMAGGCEDMSPIFIVGLPRSGSTLVEHIVSSHSQVEATMELAQLASLVKELNFRQQKRKRPLYPECLSGLDAGEFLEIGRTYVERTRILRHKAPYFIDKMPNNFEHIGLIHLALPRARIIDVRRNPMATGFSAYKQLFGSGKQWSYKLSHIGQHYLRYRELMQHWDQVLPGKVHHVVYEDLVENPEDVVRSLLSYLELPFEDACLSPELNRRAVRTASSEQVRQPIYRDALLQWKKYATQLQPLQQVLSG